MGARGRVLAEERFAGRRVNVVEMDNTEFLYKEVI